MEPAAIRYKNPGAMWPGKIATKWGSKRWIYLNDHTGQGGGGHGNKIAIFDNWVDGISAQLDLWRTSPYYRNKRFADAIRIWSGGNNVPSYIAHVKARIPGMNENTIMNYAFWRSPMGPKFLLVQSSHEAGKTIPAAPEDWVEAQKRVFKEIANKKTVATAVGGAVTTTASTIAVSKVAPDTHYMAYVGIGVGVLFVVAIIVYFIRRKVSA